MALALRLNIRGGWYHVTTRGMERKVVYRDEACCRHFLELLQEAVERFAVKIHAYALMTNHAHLVVETPEGNLSAAKEQKAFRELEKRADWRQVRRAVETVKGERWNEFCDRYGDRGRDLAFYIARRRCGISLRELGEEGRMSNYDAVAQGIRRTTQRLSTDRALKKILKAVLQCINIQT
jgi:REP element-mobilizing transposase RayT